MPLSFHNTLSRSKEQFVPLVDKKVGLYTCGPTVYNYPHLGNYRAYIFGDLLKRWLQYRGYDVSHVMNVTDVEDKIIRDSQAQRKTRKEFTDVYEKAFYEDLAILNILPASIYPRATEHIPEMVTLIKALLDKGVAYKSQDGDIYFDLRKFPHYGDLAHVDVSQLKGGASGRMLKDEYDKEHVSDFALWKAWKREDGEVGWDTELGKGRPGWHIECSAMSMKYLGETFDIHTGGVDLIFPHHQNEIAQSEAATGKRFVKYWLHNEWLLVNGQKMSKSLGNFFTLRDILAKGYSPMAIRYLLISTHYRQQLNFTFGGLDAAKNTLERVRDVQRKLREIKDGKSNPKVAKSIKTAVAAFEKAMDDDLEISSALAAVFELVKEGNVLLQAGISEANAAALQEAIDRFDTVIGCFRLEEETLTPDLQALVDAREAARKARNFAESDRLRNELKQKGIILEDTSKGVRWKRA